MNYGKIAETESFTVVNEYTPETEAQLEAHFVQRLEAQGYEYFKPGDEAGLVANLRARMEELNGLRFTDGEWERFFRGVLAAPNDGIPEKTRKFQEEWRQSFMMDDGTRRNLLLFDRRNPNRNALQVMNQYAEHGGAREVRYDVTVLVNGLPLVHVELKRRGVALREAFNQIKRYNRDGFWGGAALFEWVQIFVISNGTETKYYANTTRERHIAESRGGRRGGKKTSDSFEFASGWADARNVPIPDLKDFARTFFAQRTLRQILARYCVLTVDGALLAMRPYQIAATERILERIRISSNMRAEGTMAAGGYVWHSTGSGKTLTSFKTAVLATEMEDLDKVLFVVDRQDLDNQTQREYNRFQKDCVKGTADTKALRAQLRDPNAKIVITTIQKLSIFVKTTKRGSEDAAIYDRHVAIVFDECHRSQFGEMHDAIVRAFRRYHLFGFTGTPIFAANAVGTGVVRTTEQRFGDRLHAYTIVDAIRDGNVLPFRVETVGRVRASGPIGGGKVAAIDTEAALMQEDRIRGNVAYLLENFDRKTYRGTGYVHKGVRLRGFNAILACASVPAAMRYYAEIRRQLAAAGRTDLKVATIFTYSANEDDPDDNPFNNAAGVERLDATAREFLERAIDDYNAMFPGEGRKNFSARDNDAFHAYYMDVSEQMKSRKLDLLVVVNMFLTGFDATTLNTLWVDKPLRQHGLLQAFSRTNRILNSVKAFGNIVCFRDLEEETEKAIALFGDREAGGIVRIRTFAEYYEGWEDEKGVRHEGYRPLVGDLLAEFPLGNPIVGEERTKGFVRLFGRILRLRNLLRVFDEFEGRQILSPLDFQNYMSLYLDFYDRLRSPAAPDRENVNDDLVFEVDVVKQFDVDIDYILRMVERYRAGRRRDKELRADILRQVDASVRLRPKKELVEAFIDAYNPDGSAETWARFVRRRLAADLDALCAAQGLDRAAAGAFFDDALRMGECRTVGDAFNRLLPPMPMFGRKAADSYAEKMEAVAEALRGLFAKYEGVCSVEEEEPPSHRATDFYALQIPDGSAMGAAAEPPPNG